MSDQVGNPEDRFSHYEAHFIKIGEKFTSYTDCVVPSDFEDRFSHYEAHFIKIGEKFTSYTDCVVPSDFDGRIILHDIAIIYEPYYKINAKKKNKGADQLCLKCAADQCLCFSYIDT